MEGEDGLVGAIVNNSRFGLWVNSVSVLSDLSLTSLDSLVDSSNQACGDLAHEEPMLNYLRVLVGKYEVFKVFIGSQRWRRFKFTITTELGLWNPSTSSKKQKVHASRFAVNPSSLRLRVLRWEQEHTGVYWCSALLQLHHQDAGICSGWWQPSFEPDFSWLCPACS